MKLKRIFAFLIMVFILSGCGSESAFYNTLENTSMSSNVVNAQLMYNNRMQVTSAVIEKPLVLRQEVKAYVTAKNVKTSVMQKDTLEKVFAVLDEKSEPTQYAKEEVIAKPTGSEAVGAFAPRTTLYGMDCAGCNVQSDGSSFTATGVQLHPELGVKQSDGTWLAGITYDGYYIIAADKSIPFYSIIELRNHGISGMGISPDQPIKCIVLDRGGGVSGNHLDFYIGSEANYHNRTIVSSNSVAQATILRYGR